MLAGVSTRRFAQVGEPVGGEVEQASTSTGKTVVSEMFIERPAPRWASSCPPPGRRAPGGDDARRAGDRQPHAVVALGITTDGVRSARALGGLDRERHPGPPLLADLVHRGLDPEQAILFVIDAPRRSGARSRTSSASRARARCHRHKERNVTDAAERDRDPSAPDQGGVVAERPLLPPSGCSCSPQSSTRRGPTPPARCAKASTTR